MVGSAVAPDLAARVTALTTAVEWRPHSVRVGSLNAHPCGRPPGIDPSGGGAPPATRTPRTHLVASDPAADRCGTTSRPPLGTRLAGLTPPH